jgi:hypothetical protein
MIMPARHVFTDAGANRFHRRKVDCDPNSTALEYSAYRH